MTIPPEPEAVHSISIVLLPLYPTPSRYGYDSPPFGLMTVSEVMLDVGVLPSLQVVDVLDVVSVSVSVSVVVVVSVSVVVATPEEVLEEHKGQHIKLSEHPAIIVVAKNTTVKETAR